MLDISEDGELSDNNFVQAEVDYVRKTPTTKANYLDLKLMHKKDLDSSMVHIRVSPIKCKSLSAGSRVTYAKRKIREVTTKVKLKVAHVLLMPKNTCSKLPHENISPSIY